MYTCKKGYLNPMIFPILMHYSLQKSKGVHQIIAPVGPRSLRRAPADLVRKPIPQTQRIPPGELEVLVYRFTDCKQLFKQQFFK